MTLSLVRSAILVFISESPLTGGIVAARSEAPLNSS
jgi:hypothetical protein